MSSQPSKTRAIFERLGETEHRRRLAAEKVFRELRKGQMQDEPERTVIPLPNLSPTLR